MEQQIYEIKNCNRNIQPWLENIFENLSFSFSKLVQFFYKNNNDFIAFEEVENIIYSFLFDLSKLYFFSINKVWTNPNPKLKNVPKLSKNIIKYFNSFDMEMFLVESEKEQLYLKMLPFENFDDLEIYPSNKYYNYVAWISEKTEYLCENIGLLAELIEKQKPKMIENLCFIKKFQDVLYNLSIIYHYLECDQFQPTLINIESNNISFNYLFEKFKLDKFLYVYQKKEEKKRKKYCNLKVREFLKKWDELINKSKAESRTLLHDLIMSLKYKDIRIEKIEILLYDVTDNILQWEEFKKESIPFIESLRNNPYDSAYSYQSIPKDQ